MLKARLAALALVLPIISQAQSLEQQGDAVQPAEPSDPSGADDMQRLADDQRRAFVEAAEGRVVDALVVLRDNYPDAFARATTFQAELPLPVPQPVDLPPPPAPVEPAPAPVDPTGGPIAEPAAEPVPQDPSAPTNG